jgi:ferredoxin-type protein NapG
MRETMDPKQKPTKPVATKSSRRKFLRTLVMTGGLVGASLLGVLPVVRGWVKKLRPPGALAEDEFLASCIKCGQCVQVCPVEAIHLADLQDGVGMGTPFIDPRQQACDFSCDGLQCVLACPTGALTHHLNYPHEAKMAVAKVARPKVCLASLGEGFQGLARGADFKGVLRYEEIDRWNPVPVREHPYDLEICDLCVRQCPIEIRIAQCAEGNPPAGDRNQCPPEPAIRLVENGQVEGRMTFSPEILAGCVGCGVCEMICPAEPSVFEMDLSLRGGHA